MFLQKHLGVFLDSKLHFSIHIKHKRKRLNKKIGLLRRFSVCFARKSYLLYKNLFLDLNFPRAIFCLTNQAIKTLKVKLRRVSIKLVLQQLVPNKGHLEKDSMMNLA